MGIYGYAGLRGIGLILFFTCYAALISSKVFDSGWAIAGCACLSGIAGVAISVASWDDWVDDYWYGLYGESYT